MSRQPIKVFYSELSGRFYASDRYRIIVGDKRTTVVITGQKFDVTDDIGAAITKYKIKFSKEPR